MTVLYFGMYDPAYSRNSILISGLRQNGVTVLECQDKSPGLKKFINLYRKHKTFKGKYDVMMVGFMGHMMVPFAKLTTRKPIVFDAFLSLYDSNIFDRKLAGPHSLKAWYYWILDWLSMHLADRVLLDTQAHINYASTAFHVKKEKFARFWIGVQDAIFYPRNKTRQTNAYVVFFHGSFIPLQGVEYIIQAARILRGHEDIEFWMFGGGQTKESMIQLARDCNLGNVKFFQHVPVTEVAEKMADADICLGIFGKTSKTARVIPNKVYENLAAKKPTITADTPAIRELFTEQDLLLISAADPKSLAEAILKLKGNPDFAQRIAEHGYQTVQLSAIPRILGKQLYENLLFWKF
ncbi:MAG: glycosyltransferase [Patescibacteria group bacterium]